MTAKERQRLLSAPITVSTRSEEYGQEDFECDDMVDALRRVQRLFLDFSGATDGIDREIIIKVQGARGAK